MVIGIVYWNDWVRPIHFALTVASSNRVGLDPYLEMQGMTMKLVREKTSGPGNADKIAQNLMEVYQFRGVADEEVYKDVNTRRLLQNYRACVMTLAEAYQAEDRIDELAELLRWAEQTIPMGWEGFYAASEHYREAGRTDLAVEFMMKAADGLISQYGNHPSATYDNALALASILLNNYREFAMAEDVYRRAIALRPESYAGIHELAATLQADNRPSDALQAVLEYIQQQGANDSAVADRDILTNAMNRVEEATREVLPEVPAEQ